MAQQILQVNFNYSGSKEEYETVAGQLAHDFATVPGCVWKIWLVDEEMKQAGGIYLFTDEFAVDDFKSSSLLASVLTHPTLSNFRIRQFDVLRSPSLITYAPLLQVSIAA